MRMVKDVYLLPRIDENLNCLNGAKLFTELDLKLGYWQADLDKSSRPLTSFTVVPLGFYKSKRMPFELTNVASSFPKAHGF